MADFDKINIKGVPYNVKDTMARQHISEETDARENADAELKAEFKNADAELKSELSQKIDNIPKTYRQYRNVLDYGADPTANQSSTEAFNNAFSAGGVVFVPSGKYYVPELTVPDGVNIIIDKSTSFNPDVLPTTTEDQMFYSTGDPGEKVSPWVFYRDNNNYTPGTPRGFAKFGVIFRENNNNRNDTFFHWNVLVQTFNSTANDSENVGIYSQMIDKNDGRVWAICTDTQDPTEGNPTQQKYGMEIGFSCGGQDKNRVRVPLHISLSRKLGATGGVCSRAVLISSDGTHNMSYTDVFEIAGVTITTLFNLNNVVVSGSILDFSTVKAHDSGINMGQNSLQMGKFTIKQGNDTQLLFQIDGTTVGYIDPSGWHNGAPS